MHLRSVGNKDSLLFDREIERTAKANRKKSRQARKQNQCQNLEQIMAEANEEERTLADYAVVNPDNCATSITAPAVTAQNFEIKPAYIHLVQQNQFSGAAHEDPGDHVANFLSILEFFRIQGASDEAIRLRMFPLSLRDQARSWLMSFPQGTFTTWDALVRKFIKK